MLSINKCDRSIVKMTRTFVVSNRLACILHGRSSKIEFLPCAHVSREVINEI